MSTQSEFIFHTFEPPAELRRLLTYSFFAQGRIRYRSDKILPTGRIAVLFNIGNPHRLGKSPEPEDNPSFAHSWVDGLQTTPTYNTPLNGTHVLGLLFEPVGFHALFCDDMTALTDRITDARDTLPSSFVAQVEQILPDAESAHAHTKIYEALLALAQRGLPEWLWDLYSTIVTTRGEIDLEAEYERIGHSARHVVATFKRAVGATPKVLYRIHRLLALLEAIDPAQDVNWTDLAHQFGFYDQAHFNREFRKLSGLYPSQYLEQRRRDLPELGQGESVVFAPQQ